MVGVQLSDRVAARPARAAHDPADRSAARRASLAAKRGIDVALALVMLIAILPVLALVAMGVWLTSGGPILYEWRVVGKNGRPFTGYKFRTMVNGADALYTQLLESNEMTGPVFKMKHDPRVTRLGRFLRKYSLDELPQLWSVLKGDMSLVGPRPPLQREYARFTAWQKRKMWVKPGLTCLWQVRGRNRIKDFDDWVQLDLEYIERWSLWLDVKILLRTIPAVLFARGAS